MKTARQTRHDVSPRHARRLVGNLKPAMLSRKARSVIVDETTVLLVSAATAYEIANKVRKGKLKEAAVLERDFTERMAEAGFTLLPIDPITALRAGRLQASTATPGTA